MFATGGKRGRVPEGWDGKAALRIKAVLNEWLARRAPKRQAAAN
jgi:UDP-N-acetylglucosamine 2-epimerase (non-hydrolysing)